MQINKFKVVMCFSSGHKPRKRTELIYMFRVATIITSSVESQPDL